MTPRQGQVRSGKCTSRPAPDLSKRCLGRFRPSWPEPLTIDQLANIIGRMVNKTSLNAITTAVVAYVALTAATVLTLVILSFVESDLATGHAWGHAIIVLVFAVLLPMRLRAARAGKRSGLRAVGIISGALVVVNMVEGVLPGFFPTWMQVEMFCVAALMVANVTLVARAACRVPAGA